MQLLVDAIQIAGIKLFLFKQNILKKFI